MYRDRAQETATPAIVTVWAPARPITRPKSPAMRAPSKGSPAMAIRMSGFMRASAPQLVQIFDIDAAALAKQHHENRQPDSRLGRRHGQHEEHEHLSVDVPQVAREGDEIEIGR